MTAARSVVVATAVAAVVWPAHDAPVALAGAEDDAVLRAMKDELPRAMKLRLTDVEVPYYVSYRVTDTDTLTVKASLGALVTSEHERGRRLHVTMRVGDPSFDNSNFEDSRSFMFRGRSEMMPIEDDYDALRWSLWLASDDAYKVAAEDLEKKRAAVASRTKSKDEIADFTSEKPKSVVAEVRAPAVDPARWEALARAVSDVFSDRPAIHESTVTVVVETQTHRFASTEGTASRDQRDVVRLHIVAATQADDGMPVKHFAAFEVPDPKQLPSKADLVAHAERVADELLEIRAAAVAESYTGPVLFEGRAAAQVVHASLADQLSGTPPPKSDRPASMPGRGMTDTDLADKIGKRVAAAGLRVVDDPTATSIRGLPVVGGYAVDAEGVPARKVTLVENGKLETLLMSRTPRKEIDKSNGHGRSGGYGPVRAQVGNLAVTSKRGKSTRQLEAELLRRAKREGYDYGLVVTLLDNPAVTGMDRDAQMQMFMMSAAGGDPAPLPPLVAYKVTAPGKRERVRGAMLGAIRLRQWRDVVVGERYGVHSFRVSAMGGAFALLVGLGGEDASIVAPELLFDEVDVKPSMGSKQKPPIVRSPLADD